MERVAAFIDGFNLYHAIADLRQPHLKWVDLWALPETFIKRRTQRLDDVYYFSAFATWLPEALQRHRAYVRALRTTGVNVILGAFKKKQRNCRNCGHSWVGHEEKETDVNIAVAMLMEAFNNTYDHAFLVCQDSDLAPAVRRVTAELGKQVTVIVPPGRRHSTELIQAATAKAKLKVYHLEKCLFPQQVYDAGGNLVATRPADYDPPSEQSD